MRACLNNLSNRRLLLVTGKGGTGKSLTATALARHYAEAGKHVWLVELGRRRDQEFSRLHELLEVPRLNNSLLEIPLSHKASGQLFAARLDPADSLAEYIALKIPGGILAGLLLKNKVTGSLLEIVPGLVEIVTLGKLWYALTQAKQGPDLVIIDGSSSGHAVTLLQSAKNFARLTKQGPLFQDATAMQSFLNDQKQCGVVFVSLPETTPLKEAQDFIKLINQDSKVALLLINKCMPDDGLTKSSAIPAWAQKAIEYRQRRRQHEQTALNEYNKTHQTNFPHCTLQTLPLFFANNGISLVNQTLNHWRGD
jgi:arsenite-transporting ATPase